MKLPEFKYHPDPLKSKSVKKRAKVCICCNKEVDYIYMGSTYGPEILCEELCPWCIADGSAHKKFDATFSDDHPLVRDGIKQEIIEEVTQRTPGYLSWQQDEWVTHCNDACAFIGDADIEILKTLTPEERGEIFRTNEIDDAGWKDLLSYYEPRGDPAIYHFKCLHCGKNVFNYDCS